MLLPVEERIRSSLPVPMDERLLNRTVQPIDANSNLPRILNRDLQPVFSYVCESLSYRFTSGFIISSIPCAANTYHQFSAPVDVVFC
jgi:hypothetical protein